MTGPTPKCPGLRLAAAIVVWRAIQTASAAKSAEPQSKTRAQIQVYLAQRAEHLAGFGGFWAFAGGSVDTEDEVLDVDFAAGPKALVAAAARELFEETGILAVRRTGRLEANGVPIDSGPFVDPDDSSHWRTEVLGDAGAFGRGLKTRQLALDGRAFVPLGRWQTPPFSPMRFDCQYFALQLPCAQSPCLWPGELTQGVWLTPQAALDAHDDGQMLLAYPVLCTLRLIEAAQNDIEAASQLSQLEVPGVARQTQSLVQGVRVLPVASPTLPPYTHTNCYILGERQLVIVDPGTPYPQQQKMLLDFIDGLVKKGGKVCEIWLTHAHPDHTGCAALAQARYKVPIAAHKDCAAALAADGACTLDRHIQDDETLDLAGDYRWRALHTPGHAPGHLCFYETSRRHLLAGDNVLGLGSSMVAPAPHGSMQAYMQSLQRLSRLDVGILLPGHGPPIATAATTIGRLIAHRQAREAQILAALGQTPISTQDLLNTIYADVKAQARPMAQLNLLAHLEKLTQEHKIQAIDAGFVRC